MNDRTAIVIGSMLAGIAVLIVLVVAYFALSQQRIPDEAPNQEAVFPESTGLDPAESTAQVLTQTGQVTVRDFIDNGVTTEDPANPGVYYLAGSSGACDAQGNCPSGYDAPRFEITYLESEGAFNIALTAEPLGQARREAEQFLMQTLGISQEAMCSLVYFLSTDSYMSASFGGMHLGFSFCPGAVSLPS